MRMRFVAAAAAIFAALPARAALVLEYVQVPAITSGPATGPALTGPLVMDATGQVAPATVFLQIVLRDSLGSGPEHGQPGTVPWQTNGGNAGLGSLGLGAFHVRFDGAPGVALNPAPVAPANVRLVDGTTYANVSGSMPPPSHIVRFGGLLNFGFEPGAVPDPANQNRIPLFNLRIVAIANGTGLFRLREPNPTPASADTVLLHDADIGSVPNAGYYTSIDDLLFGPSWTNTYDLPVIVVPEPSALSLASLALLSAARCRSRGERRSSPPLR